MLLNNREVNFGRIKTKLSSFAWKIINDWSFSLTALIAYYLLISVLPLILSMFAVVSLISNNNKSFENRIRDRLIKAFPEHAFSNVLDALLNSLSKRAGLVFIISFMMSLFTGSRLFASLDDVLTIIYHIRERTVLNQNILAIKMTLAFIILIPLITLLSSIPALTEKNETFYQILVTTSSYVLTFLFFQLTYIILPKRRMYWRHTYAEVIYFSK